MKAAYSYIRWSSDRQTDGTSHGRQTDIAVKYAAENGLALSDKTYLDAGVSAYRGKNAAEGALRAFIDAVDAGEVEPGSYLLIENLDRLSRLPPRRALRLLEDIVERDITVVAMSENKTYTKSSLDDLMDLIYVLMGFERSHKESLRKGELVRKAWDRNRETKTIFTAVCPAWLEAKPDKSGWTIIPEHASTVQRMFELADGPGYGSPKIASILNEEGRPTFGGAERWVQQLVMNVLKNEAVVGIYQQRGGEFRREGYFEPVVAKDVFYRVQEQIHSRKLNRTGGVKGENVANLFSGLLYCSCGDKVRFVNGNKKYLYLRCMRAFHNEGCDADSVPYLDFERRLLWEVFTSGKFVPPQASNVVGDPRPTWRAELAATEKALENIMSVIEGGKEFFGGSAMLMRRLAELEAEKTRVTQQIAKYVPPQPVEEGLTAAFELLTKYRVAEKAGESTYDLRLMIANQFRKLIAKIVLPNEAVIAGPRGMKRRACVYGPVVPALTRSYYGWAAIAMSRAGKRDEAEKVMKELRAAKADGRSPNVTIPSGVDPITDAQGPSGDGGIWVTYGVKNWGGHGAIARRRTAKKVPAREKKSPE